MRVRARELVDPEEPRQHARDVAGLLRDGRLERRQADRREGAREAHRRARREGERAVVSLVELVDAVVVAEREHVPVRALPDQLRVGDRHVAAVAVEVGHRDEELERVGRRHQRLELGRLRPGLVHVAECAVHPLRDRVPFEHRLLDGAREQQRHLQQRRQPVGPAQQHLDVAALEPEVAQRVLRPVVRDRLREVDAVDPAGRGSGDDIDDDTRADPGRVATGELREQLAVDPLARRRRGGAAVGERRGLDEALELLRRPVHVDRERCTAVENDREPKLADVAALGCVGSWSLLARHELILLPGACWEATASRVEADVSSSNSHRAARSTGCHRSRLTCLNSVMMTPGGATPEEPSSRDTPGRPSSSPDAPDH